MQKKRKFNENQKCVAIIWKYLARCKFVLKFFETSWFTNPVLKNVVFLLTLYLMSASKLDSEAFSQKIAWDSL